MYRVVGCGECSALWVVADDPETTACPRCGTRHRVDRLKTLAETEDEDAAREARAALLADRQGEGEAFGALDDFASLGERATAAGLDEAEFLDRAGMDAEAVEAIGERAERGRSGGSQSRAEVVRAAVREQDVPAERDVVVYAEARGVPAEAARDLLADLREAGEVVEDDGTLRLV